MFQWSFSSRSDKSATWYIFAIMIALVFVVLGFINQMYLMSIVVFIFVGVYILFENNSSPQVEVTVNEEWVQIGKVFYEYQKISEFSILYHDKVPVYVRFHFRKWLIPQIDVRLTQDVNPQELREYLLQFIAENENEELTSVDYIMDAMRL